MLIKTTHLEDMSNNYECKAPSYWVKNKDIWLIVIAYKKTHKNFTII